MNKSFLQQHLPDDIETDFGKGAHIPKSCDINGHAEAMKERREQERTGIVKHYITFGQQHVHSLNGITFDKDCVAVINCNSTKQGDHWAFEWFKGEFHQHTPIKPDMKYFPRGLIVVNPDFGK